MELTKAIGIELNQALEAFRVNFPYTKVTAHTGMMVYTIRHKQLAGSVLREAEALIKILNAPLKARLNMGIIDATLIIEAKDN